MFWDEAFAGRYEEWSGEMTADIAFYVSLARQTVGPLVELAVGNGRVAIPVAQATGQRVIGIDSSPAMLSQARARAAAAGVQLDLYERDDQAVSGDRVDAGEVAMARPGSLASSGAIQNAAGRPRPVVGDPAGDADFRAGGGIRHVAYAETTTCGG